MRASSTPKLERLGDIVVGAGIEAENGVGLGVLPGQHDDGPLKPFLRISLQASRPSSRAGRHRAGRGRHGRSAQLEPIRGVGGGIVSNSSCRESCSLKDSRRSSSSSMIRICAHCPLAAPD